MPDLPPAKRQRRRLLRLPAGRRWHHQRGWARHRHPSTEASLSHPTRHTHTAPARQKTREKTRTTRSEAAQIVARARRAARRGCRLSTVATPLQAFPCGLQHVLASNSPSRRNSRVSIHLAGDIRKRGNRGGCRVPRTRTTTGPRRRDLKLPISRNGPSAGDASTELNFGTKPRTPIHSRTEVLCEGEMSVGEAHTHRQARRTAALWQGRTVDNLGARPRPTLRAGTWIDGHSVERQL